MTANDFDKLLERRLGLTRRVLSSKAAEQRVLHAAWQLAKGAEV